MIGFVLFFAVLLLTPTFYDYYTDRMVAYTKCNEYQGQCIPYISECREVVRLHPILWSLIQLGKPEYSATQYISLLLVIGSGIYLSYTMRMRVLGYVENKREAYLYSKYGGEKHKKKQREFISISSEHLSSLYNQSFFSDSRGNLPPLEDETIPK